MFVNAFRQIRKTLGVTQAAVAEALGVSQGNVSFYERGQTIPPEIATRLIEFARGRGHDISYNDIYGFPPPGGAAPVDAPTSPGRAAVAGVDSKAA